MHTNVSQSECVYTNFVRSQLVFQYLIYLARFESPEAIPYIFVFNKSSTKQTDYVFTELLYTILV